MAPGRGKRAASADHSTSKFSYDMKLYRTKGRPAIAMQEAELQHILDYVQRYSAAHGFPPSYAEIAEACRLGSVGHVQYRINRLEREGRVTRTPGRARSLVVVSRKVDDHAAPGPEQNKIKRRPGAFLKAMLTRGRG
jgi:hypothetical protein